MMMRELLRRVERLESSAEASAEERALAAAKAELDKASAARDAASKKIWNGPWQHPDVTRPRFEDVCNDYEQDARAAKTKYAPFLQRIRQHEEEVAAANLVLETLNKEVLRLQGEVEEKARSVRTHALARYRENNGALDAEQLKSKAQSLYWELTKLRNPRFRDENYAKTWNDTDNELDAVAELLKEKYNIATTYPNNEITFTKLRQ